MPSTKRRSCSKRAEGRGRESDVRQVRTVRTGTLHEGCRDDRLYLARRTLAVRDANNARACQPRVDRCGADRARRSCRHSRERHRIRTRPRQLIGTPSDCVLRPTGCAQRELQARPPSAAFVPSFVPCRAASPPAVHSCTRKRQGGRASRRSASKARARTRSPSGFPAAPDRGRTKGIRLVRSCFASNRPQASREGVAAPANDQV